jgi:GDP-L-fucose synthase
VAKIAGIEMCRAYNRQYGTRFLAAMPTNLYGPGDNYDPHNSHLMPALIRKMHAAKVAGSQEVVLWGSGTPRREFLHNQDAADACIFLLNLPEKSFSELLNRDDAGPLVNVGCGEDRTIRDLAELVARTVGVAPRLMFDSAKPDGTPRKLLDISRLAGLGWKPRISIEEGLRETYADFCSRCGELQSNEPGSTEPGSSEPQSARRGQSKPVPQCAS